MYDRWVKDGIAAGVLNKDKHGPLIADIKLLAARAGIHEKWVCVSANTVCGPGERQYMSKFKKHVAEGAAGMVYIGTFGHLENRMSALTGVFLRNYKDARLMTLTDLLTRMQYNDPPDPRILLIPYFYTLAPPVELKRGEKSKLVDYLRDRKVRGRQTILSVESLDGLATAYGSHLRTLIEENYLPYKG